MKTDEQINNYWKGIFTFRKGDTTEQDIAKNFDEVRSNFPNVDDGKIRSAILGTETLLDAINYIEKHYIDVCKHSVDPITVHNPVKPEYYGKGQDVIDFCHSQGLNFTLGSSVKYIVRRGKKDPSKEIEDLRKAINCIEREIAFLEGNGI